MCLSPAGIGAKLLGLALPVETAKKLAPLGFVLALTIVAMLAFGAWQAFDWFNDRDAVKDASNEANVEFSEDMNTSTGEADIASDAAAAEHQAKVRNVEELIDEALKENCVISDYLASNGDVCLWRPSRVSRPAAQ